MRGASQVRGGSRSSIKMQMCFVFFLLPFRKAVGFPHMRALALWQSVSIEFHCKLDRALV